MDADATFVTCRMMGQFFFSFFSPPSIVIHFSLGLLIRSSNPAANRLAMKLNLTAMMLKSPLDHREISIYPRKESLGGRKIKQLASVCYAWNVLNFLGGDRKTSRKPLTIQEDQLNSDTYLCYSLKAT
jgi:hypothetical protein